MPDVAFVSFDRLPFDEEAAADIPHVAPDVVVEVFSPGDRQADIDEKTRVYFACDASVTFLVDTQTQSVTILDVSQTRIQSRHDLLTHSAMPGFALRASELFDRIRPKP